MNFLNVLDDYLNTDKYYKMLLNFESKELENLYRFINIKWTLTVNTIKQNIYSNKKLCKYSNFNNNLKSFIDNNIVLALFVKNIIERY